MSSVKKFFKYLRIIIIGALWTCIYVLCTVSLFISIWGFNYLSAKDWRIISAFWNRGGTIKSGGDYLFLLCLILLVPLWIWGWKKLYRIDFINLLLVPLNWYQKRAADQYMKSMSKIKIHNIGVSIENSAKEEFDSKIKSREQAIQSEAKAAESIRAQIKNKLSDS